MNAREIARILQNMIEEAEDNISKIKCHDEVVGLDSRWAQLKEAIELGEELLKAEITEKEGQVLSVDVVSGCEGLSLSFMSYDNNKKESGVGTRIDGPKPWGGGRTLYSCDIGKGSAEQILEEIYRVYPDAKPKIDCRKQPAAPAPEPKEVPMAMLKELFEYVADEPEQWGRAEQEDFAMIVSKHMPGYTAKE